MLTADTLSNIMHGVSMVVAPSPSAALIDYNTPQLFTCDTCAKTFRHHHHLTQHQVVHTNARPHHCPLCACQFKQARTLQRHLQSTHYLRFHDPHNKRNKQQQPPLVDSTTRKQPYACEYCGQTFRTMNNVAQHHVKYHKMAVSANLFAPSAGVVGALMDTKMERMADVRHTVATASTTATSKPWQCVQCGKTSATEWAHNAHMAIHDDARPFLCSECGRSFKWDRSLARHR
jgi:KRAB domain-containing zinc finger protein